MSPAFSALLPPVSLFPMSNPHLILNFGYNSIRKVKFDPADFKKIARYTLDNWVDLREHSPIDYIRTRLKTLRSSSLFYGVAQNPVLLKL